MTTHAEVKDLLENIHTNFFDSATGKELKVHDFSSFLVCENPLPINPVILHDFKGHEADIKPTELLKRYQPDFTFKKSFFNEEKDQPFNNKYMFVALNVAARAEENDISEWCNFRDTKLPTNTYKLYLELNNDERFRGSYITDIIKNVVDSDSGNVSQNFLASGKQALSENNEKVLGKSAAVFMEECHAVQPEKLVLFGGTAEKVVVKMLKNGLFKNDDYVTDLIKNHKTITHYSYVRAFDEWINKYANEAFNTIEGVG